MKLEINHGRIVGIKNQILNPVLPDSNLSYIQDKDLYKEIRNYIKSEHTNLENKLTFNDGVMKQSNPRLAVTVDMFSKKYIPNYRLATQFDLEQDLDFTKGTYNDSGLALRNLTGANSEQAKYLSEQLKRRGVKMEDLPIWINLRGLELDKNLNFNLTDESAYSTESSLNWPSGTGYSKTNKLGLPKERNNSSSRQIWTGSHALSSCFLYRGSILDSINSNLSYSNDYGRVVLAKPRSG